MSNFYLCAFSFFSSYLTQKCNQMYRRRTAKIYFALVLADDGSNQYLLMFQQQFSTTGFLEVLIASRQKGSITFQYGLNQTAVQARDIGINPGYNSFNFSTTTFQGHGNEINRKVILLNSSVPISVFGMNQQYSSTEGYMALPVSVLGKHYRVVGFKPEADKSEFMVAALHNNTQVNITFVNGNSTPSLTGMRCKNLGYNKNVCTVVLEELQTLHIQNNYDMTGTQIKSNKSIGVISGSKCSHVIGYFAACQPLVSYLLQIKHWGQKFIVPPLIPSPVHVVKIWPAEDNTRVTITNNITGTQRYIVNASSGWNKTFRRRLPLYIVSDKPIMVTVFSAEEYKKVEASMVAIPSVGHYNSSYTIAFTKAGDYDNKLLLFGNREIMRHVTVNGSPVYGKGDIIDVPSGNNVILHLNVSSHHAFVETKIANAAYGAIAYGISRGKYPLVFAYPGGMKFPKI